MKRISPSLVTNVLAARYEGTGPDPSCRKAATGPWCAPCRCRSASVAIAVAVAVPPVAIPVPVPIPVPIPIAVAFAGMLAASASGLGVGIGVGVGGGIALVPGLAGSGASRLTGSEAISPARSPLTAWKMPALAAGHGRGDRGESLRLRQEPGPGGTEVGSRACAGAAARPGLPRRRRGQSVNVGGIPERRCRQDVREGGLGLAEVDRSAVGRCSRCGWRWGRPAGDQTSRRGRSEVGDREAAARQRQQGR